ncbi:MAG: glycoside hydrolase family 5 protein [Treponema sp.]|nr:glycoside hydrolase family 5 protein [Treponema sp.]
MTIKRTLYVIFAILILPLAACCSSSGASGSGSSDAVSSALNHIPSRPDSIREHPLESVSGKTAFNYLRDENILSGWNMGNTLDSHSGGFGGETGWGNPRVNQELMNGVKAAGFDIIRIPVTWMGEIGSAPDYRITPARLSRVGDVVDMAYNAGLKVIINIHHDGATESGGRDLGWLSIARASRNQENDNQITSQFVRVWRQIAVYFQNYGDWLIFEPFNELHDGNWQTCNDVSQLITLNNWNQAFVNVVRSSGGNNASRFLLVGAYCNDNRQALSAAFTLPVDSSPDKLIVSFHYYDPYQLTIQGSRSAWGTPNDRQTVIGHFAPFKPRYIDNNIPVIIGECGAVLQLYPGDSAREEQARQSRLDYLSHVFASAKNFGLIPIYWDNGSTSGNGEKFGLLDRRTGQPVSPEAGTLLTTIINAVK